MSKKDTKLTILSDSSFNSINSKNKLYRHYGVRSLSSFGKFTYSMIGSLGAILDYIEITKIGTNLSLKRPVVEKKKSFLEIDENTRKNLEINKSIMGEKKSSLIKLDQNFKSPIKVSIKKDKEQGCGIFGSIYIKDVKNKESPDWLKKRIVSLGLKPISAIVDITNFIMFDLND